MSALPLPYNILKQELPSSYLSYLVRVFIIKWETKYSVNIKKSEFSRIMKLQGWNRQRICDIWNKWQVWTFIKYIDKDHLILNWKENVVWDKWFLTRISRSVIWYYEYCAFITEIYALRPVTQTNEFKEKYKLKKNKAYNKEIIKRSLGDKKWRWQRKLSNQVWCTLKTVNNRLKKSETVKVLKRYDNYNWFRINKTNLYFTKENISFYIYYNKNNTTKRRNITLNSVHSSLVNNKAIFLNNCISLNKSDDTIYKYSNLLQIS